MIVSLTYGLGAWFWVLAAVVVLLFALWIWMLADCLTRQFANRHEKINWTLVLILFNVVGAIVYFFFGRQQQQRPSRR
jgi:uncharacterized BrkB/YihY/UPF0761 family membrane protein